LQLNLRRQIKDSPRMNRIVERFARPRESGKKVSSFMSARAIRISRRPAGSALAFDEPAWKPAAVQRRWPMAESTRRTARIGIRHHAAECWKRGRDLAANHNSIVLYLYSTSPMPRP